MARRTRRNSLARVSVAVRNFRLQLPTQRGHSRVVHARRFVESAGARKRRWEQYDSFAQPESDHHEIGELVANPRARRVVVYTWNFHPDLIASARQHGAHGYLSKTLPARELVAALEAVHAGEVVISDVPPRGRSAVGLDWPGRGEGLSDRESEILALITQGKSNAEVAKLTYLSPNTVKSYIRTIYRKIDGARGRLRRGADGRGQHVRSVPRPCRRRGARRDDGCR